MSDIDKHAVKKRFDDAAKGAEALYKELSLLSSRVELEVDRRACRSMITDLGWIMENCTVAGLHQIGEALDDPGAGLAFREVDAREEM